MNRRKHPLMCGTCKEIKTTKDFLIRGNGERRSECNSCRSVYQKKYWDSGGKEKKKIYTTSEIGKQVEIKRKLNQRLKDPLFSIKLKARDAVNKLVSNGELPRVSTLSCFDCGEQAREYDHYLGYAKENWLDIQPVCWICHSKRTRKNV